MTEFHHVEIWLADPQSAHVEWGWLLHELGCTLRSEWEGGQSWSVGAGYLTLTGSPTITGTEHDRRRPGVNHLAFSVGTRAKVDAVMGAAAARGWQPLYQERYPHAGGPQHYAGWVQNSDGFKVELVATDG